MSIYSNPLFDLPPEAVDAMADAITRDLNAEAIRSLARRGHGVTLVCTPWYAHGVYYWRQKERRRIRKRYRNR